MTTTLGEDAAAAPAPVPDLPRQDGVLFTLRSLEPWVAWSIALYTALLAIVAYRELPWIWVFVVYAALVGQWAQRSPARQPVQFFLRAAALLAAAFVLLGEASVQVGEHADLLFFWVSVPALCYAFLLPRAWSGPVLALAVLTDLLAALDPGSRSSWLQVSTQVVFLCVFTPLVAMRFGDAMRRVGTALEGSLWDGTTGLYNRDGLLQHGQELAEVCGAEGVPLTLVVFDARGSGLTQGRPVMRKLLRAWVRRLHRLAGERGLAARSTESGFALLLPATNAEKTLKRLDRTLGNPVRVSVTDGAGQAVLQPSLEIADVVNAASLEELLNGVERRLGVGDSSFAPLQDVSEPVSDPEPA